MDTDLFLAPTSASCSSQILFSLFFFSRQLVRLDRLFAHSGAGLPRKLAGSTLHLVDGIRRRTVDHGDIWLEGLAEDILVQLLGTLGLGQEDEAEAGVDHPVDEPVALLALVLGVEGLEGRKGR